MVCKPFDTYIAECAQQIRRRHTIYHYPIDAKMVIAANSPFELRPNQPATAGKFRYGALLIHGLLDSPFSLRDVGTHLKNAGILSRAILLPGHGSCPEDLLAVRHDEWINTVRYGIESLRQEADTIFLVGFSTGATLSIYHALNDARIQGIILIAPALKIRAPVSTIVRWPVLANFFSREDKWLSQDDETNYVKYESVPFKPVIELGKLIETIKQIKSPLTCPTLVIMSREDETVSARAALHFFTNNANNDKNRFILYSARHHPYPDQRIEVRSSIYPELRIRKMSHIALPFSPDNPHYGQQGDYEEHSNPRATQTIYGAYNRLEIKLYNQLRKLGLLKKRRLSLTYNPDFAYMAESIVRFITTTPPT